MLDRLIAIDPDNQWAQIFRDYLLHMEAMSIQYNLRRERYRGQVELGIEEEWIVGQVQD